MTQLDASIYDVGDTLIENGSPIQKLIFIVSGSCDLYGIHEVEQFDITEYKHEHQNNPWLQKQ